MYATTEDGKTINLGRTFIEALSGAYVWNIKTNKYAFTVNYECTMDKAIQHVRDLLSKEHKHSKCEVFTAQRHK